MANGHGGARRNSGRQVTSPRAAALRILEAAVAYCAGIAGDPRRQEPIDVTWARYLDQVGEAGRLAAAADLRAAVDVSFKMLDRSVTVRIEEDAGEGLSALIRGLDRAGSVPGESRSELDDDEDQAPLGLADQGAPDTLSGALVQQLGLPLGQALDERLVDDVAVGEESLVAPREVAEEAGARAGRDEAPQAPPGPPPPSFDVDPQNLDFLGREAAP